VTTIKNLDELNRLVATSAFCPEPPLPERRAIHESGAWLWVSANDATLATMHLLTPPHWAPAPFSSDPAASYALRQKLESIGYGWSAGRSGSGDMATNVSIQKTWNRAFSASCIGEFALEKALCLAALRALGVKFTLADSWDSGVAIGR